MCRNNDGLAMIRCQHGVDIGVGTWCAGCAGAYALEMLKGACVIDELVKGACVIDVIEHVLLMHAGAAVHGGVGALPLPCHWRSHRLWQRQAAGLPYSTGSSGAPLACTTAGLMTAGWSCFGLCSAFAPAHATIKIHIGMSTGHEQASVALLYPVLLLKM